MSDVWWGCESSTSAMVIGCHCHLRSVGRLTNIKYPGLQATSYKQTALLYSDKRFKTFMLCKNGFSNTKYWPSMSFAHFHISLCFGLMSVELWIQASQKGLCDHKSETIKMMLLEAWQALWAETAPFSSGSSGSQCYGQIAQTGRWPKTAVATGWI